MPNSFHRPYALPVIVVFEVPTVKVD